MSLIKRMRIAVKEFNSAHPTRQGSFDTIETAEHRDEYIRRKAFTPKSYANFSKLFNQGYDNGQHKFPDRVDTLIKRLSYNPNDSVNVQIGKYIALLIGRREIATSGLEIQAGYREPAEVETRYKILDEIGNKLKEFPFYETSHVLNTQRAGREYGHEGYVPPIARISNMKEAA
ncbi:hypothetical protein J4204_00730 [Candidatus Woesearchaeota archaeon]|nr:hypothetical protein [Candidatus Woesearchaeota archaeon]